MPMTAIATRSPRAIAGPRRQTRGATFVGGGLVVLAIAFLGLWPISHRSGLVQFEECLLLGYTAIRAGTCIKPDRPRMVFLIALLWVYTLFGLVQTVQLSKGDNPFHVYASDSAVAKQLFVMLLGLLVLDVVSTWAQRSGRTRTATRGRSLSLGRVTVLSVVTIVASPVLIPRLGGLHALFGSRLYVSQALGSFGGSLTSNVSTTNTILFEFSEVSPFLCLYALLRLRQAGAFKFLARPWYLLMAAALGVLVVLFDNPISQPRFWVATTAVAVALGGKWMRRVGFQVLFVAGFVVVTVVLFPYLDLTRFADVNTAMVASSGVTDTYLNKTDYGTMQDVTNAVTYVDNHGETDGKQILGAALFFVPRSVWPGKANDTGALLATDIGFVQNLNLDAPLWAEGYIDFNLGGVVAVLGLFGYFVGRWERAYDAFTNRRLLMATLVPMFAGYELILLRGSLLQATGRLALMLVLGWLICTRARPSDSSARARSQPSHCRRGTG